MDVRDICKLYEYCLNDFLIPKIYLFAQLPIKRETSKTLDEQF